MEPYSLNRLYEMWQQRYTGLAKPEFTKRVPWSQRESIARCDEAGVYILALMEPQGRQETADPLDEGIIYIGETHGETRTLRTRWNEFQREAFGTGAAHSGATTFREKYKPSENAHIREQLHVSACPVYWHEPDYPAKRVNPTDAQERELPEGSVEQTARLAKLLEVCLRGIYVLKWGRLPDCNRE